MRAIQVFEVSLKAFIVRDGRALFVREADSGYWELPGGRIDVGEEWQPHVTILEREMREELGEGFSVRFGDEAVTWTRQRPSDSAFLFLLARLGHAVAGEPALSDEHTELAWLDREASARLAYPPQSGYRAAIPALWQLVDRAASREA
ncbi:MAG: NUDIX domain-containing protein [Hyphomicrobiaceae bacterium]